VKSYKLRILGENVCDFWKRIDTLKNCFNRLFRRLSSSVSLLGYVGQPVVLLQIPCGKISFSADSFLDIQIIMSIGDGSDSVTDHSMP
jgi:hypothetical protein